MERSFVLTATVFVNPRILDQTPTRTSGCSNSEHLLARTKAAFEAPGILSQTPLVPADVPIWNTITRAERCLGSLVALGLDRREVAAFGTQSPVARSMPMLRAALRPRFCW